MASTNRETNPSTLNMCATLWSTTPALNSACTMNPYYWNLSPGRTSFRCSSCAEEWFVIVSASKGFWSCHYRSNRRHTSESFIIRFLWGERWRARRHRLSWCAVESLVCLGPVSLAFYAVFGFLIIIDFYMFGMANIDARLSASFDLSSWKLYT